MTRRFEAPREAARLMLGAALVAMAVLLTAGSVRAGDEPEKDTSKTPPKAGAPHLRFQKTYAAALLEARVRNMPVFVSRHKDF